MTNLSQRSQQPECMDTETVDYETFRHCLTDLALINRYTFAYAPTLKWLNHVMQTYSASPLAIWDVGCGGGDMLRAIYNDNQQKGYQVALTGYDLHHWSIKTAREYTPPDWHVEYHHQDVFAVTGQADVIICSLFTHHLDDEALRKFLTWLDAHSRVGWLISDLHRHWLPYHFIRLAVQWAGMNRLVRHDAPVSVARGFTRSDWRQNLSQVGLDDAAIQWHWPFRYTVSRLKPIAGEV